MSSWPVVLHDDSSLCLMFLLIILNSVQSIYFNKRAPSGTISSSTGSSFWWSVCSSTKGRICFYTRNYLGKLLGHPDPHLRILSTLWRIQGVPISWFLFGTACLGECLDLAEVLAWRTPVIVTCFAVTSVRVSVSCFLSSWSIV